MKRVRQQQLMQTPPTDVPQSVYIGATNVRAHTHTRACAHKQTDYLHVRGAGAGPGAKRWRKMRLSHTCAETAHSPYGDVCTHTHSNTLASATSARITNGSCSSIWQTMRTHMRHTHNIPSVCAQAAANGIERTRARPPFCIVGGRRRFCRRARVAPSGMNGTLAHGFRFLRPHRRTTHNEPAGQRRALGCACVCASTTCLSTCRWVFVCVCAGPLTIRRKG